MTPLDGSIVSVALQPSPRPAAQLQRGDLGTGVLPAGHQRVPRASRPARRRARSHALLPGRRGRVHRRLRGVGPCPRRRRPDRRTRRTGRGRGSAQRDGGRHVTAAYPPAERGRALGFMTMWVYVGSVRAAARRPHRAAPHVPGRRRQLALDLLREHPGRRSHAARWPLAAAGRTPDRGGCGGAAGETFDLAGAVLLAFVLAAFIVPLTFAFQWGWGSRRGARAARRGGAGRVASSRSRAACRPGVRPDPPAPQPSVRYRQPGGPAQLRGDERGDGAHRRLPRGGAASLAAGRRADADLAAGPHGGAVGAGRPAVGPCRYAQLAAAACCCSPPGWSCSRPCRRRLDSRR